MSDPNYESRVISFPGAKGLTAVRETAAAAASQQFASIGSGAVDDWGRDPALVELTRWFGRIRWNTVVGGLDHLPRRGGALLVVNTRTAAQSALFVALTLSGAVHRPVRYVGRSDVAPLGSLGRRLGGLLDRPDEVAGALRAGELIVMGATSQLHPRQVGRIDHRLLGAAVTTKTPVYPVAAASSPWSRGARVEIGPVQRPGRKRRGPLTELELADAVEQRIAHLLAEMGGAQTGTILDWLPFSGMGAN